MLGGHQDAAAPAQPPQAHAAEPSASLDAEQPAAAPAAAAPTAAPPALSAAASGDAELRALLARCPSPLAPAEVEEVLSLLAAGEGRRLGGTVHWGGASGMRHGVVTRGDASAAVSCQRAQLRLAGSSPVASPCCQMRPTLRRPSPGHRLRPAFSGPAYSPHPVDSPFPDLLPCCSQDQRCNHRGNGCGGRADAGDDSEGGWGGAWLGPADHAGGARAVTAVDATGRLS